MAAHAEIQPGLILESGDRFPVDGFYSYVDHKNGDEDDCFVSPRARGGMLFLKGMKVPDLGACSHHIRWRLNAIYK
ncbi:MAG: hypothetical protein MPJ06_03840 [Nitrosopumilus sp.]|nr:hypothetical protein [Nitrosopumilus sp.]MDA7943121.1 hypothetical protein [Nitrosopumilus sp.]